MGLLNVGGEITRNALFDVAKVVRDLGNDIGYTAPKYGFDINTAAVVRTIHAQSPDISQGVCVQNATQQRALITTFAPVRTRSRHRAAPRCRVQSQPAALSSAIWTISTMCGAHADNGWNDWVRPRIGKPM
jgi:hypothetical protein